MKHYSELLSLRITKFIKLNLIVRLEVTMLSYLLPNILLSGRISKFYYIVFLYYLAQRTWINTPLNLLPIRLFEEVMRFHLVQAYSLLRIFLQKLQKEISKT